MTGIGRTDQMLLRLREQLQRRSRTDAKGRATKKAGLEAAPLDRLRRSDALARPVDEEYRRTFVRALLNEQFGDRVANAPEFARVVEDVWRILSEDEEMRLLVDRAIVQLRSVG